MFTFVGFLVGVFLVGFGIITGKAPVEIFLNWQGLAIVVGGTIASTFVSFPIREVLIAFRGYFVIFRTGAHDLVKAVTIMVNAIRTYQVEGLDRLMTELKAAKKLWILRDGVQMLANGYAKEETQLILEDQIRWQMAREMKQHELFATMAKLAPAFGMIGTLIGLINMLITLQSQPGQVGLGLAIALTTTFYGLVLANIIFMPISEKIKEQAENNLLLETMQLETLLMMYDNRNYVFARDKLSAYLSAGSRRKVTKLSARQILTKKRHKVKESA
ncbi:MAG: motility protein A [bacterium]